MNKILFRVAEFVSTPPGFYWLMGTTALCSAAAAFGLVNVVTFYLSVLAIVLTGVVLVQNYRDTAAIQAKLNEIVLSLPSARNQVVGLEHAAPEQIADELQAIERRAVRAQAQQFNRGSSTSI